MEPHEVAGQYELKECRVWGERPQEGFMPFQYDGVIPSNLGVAFSDAIQNPIIVSIIDTVENIRDGEVAILPSPLNRLSAKPTSVFLRCR
jgi:hypothetical protein